MNCDFLLITENPNYVNKYSGYTIFNSSLNPKDFKYILIVGEYPDISTPETSYVSWVIPESSYINRDDLLNGKYDNIDIFFTDHLNPELKQRYTEQFVCNLTETVFFNHRLAPPRKSLAQNSCGGNGGTLEETCLNILEERITFEKLDKLKKSCSIEGLTGKKYTCELKHRMLSNVYEKLYGDKSVIYKVNTEETCCDLFSKNFNTVIRCIDTEYNQKLRYKETNNILFLNKFYLPGLYEFLAENVYNNPYLKERLDINLNLENNFSSKVKWLGFFYNSHIFFPKVLDDNCKKIIVFTEHHKKLIDEKYNTVLLDYPFLENYPEYDIKKCNNEVSYVIDYNSVVNTGNDLILLYKCVQINNPVYVEKNELTEYVLGENYPFFKNVEFTYKNTCKAFNYLKRLDKSKHSKELFLSKFMGEIERGDF